MLFDFAQYSPEWWNVRRGIPTASEFDRILTPATGKLSKSADGYACQLIGERLSTEYPLTTMNPTTAAMERGTAMETAARSWYAVYHGLEVREVGFALSECGRFGCSPDGLVDGDGGIEIKCPMPHTMVGWLLSGELPNDYKAQVHGSLIVTGRQWWDFVAYCPGLPELVVRVTPDDYTEKLREALELFHARYQELENQVVALAGAGGVLV